MAGAICFDADFAHFIRGAGHQDDGTAAAELLIVPANESKAFKRVHMEMAAFRAVENGVALVRPAASGISAAFDQYGRALAVSDYFDPGDRTMTAQVPLGSVPTVYARTGDLFAWTCLAGVALAIVSAWMRA
jgi:apolipoprotein N-acyltransferase